MADAIEVSGLVKKYGQLRAVDGIDFSVGKGEVFAFLGPNGAGKTTTVEILEGLRPSDEGAVRVLGQDPWRDSLALHARIGVIPQDFQFFPKLTPKEAISLWAGLGGFHPDAKTLLNRVELADKASSRFETLSGGQRQKVGLALALVNDPELCFLDEPTTGLDPRARRSIWDVIRSLKAEGRTVFLTTHYLEEAQLLADRIAIIDHGKIIAAGTPEDIIGQYGRPERLRIEAAPALAEFLRTQVGIRADVVDGAVEVELRQKQDAVGILSAVEASGLPWTGFSTRTDTLEDVFIRLVGRLDDGAVTLGPKKPEAAA